MKKGKKSGLGMKDLMSLTLKGEVLNKKNSIKYSESEINKLKKQIEKYKKELKNKSNNNKKSFAPQQNHFKLEINEIYKSAIKFIKEEEYFKALKPLNLINYIQPQNIKVLNNLGVIYYELGFIQEAFSSFKSILKIDPENEIAKENLKELEGR